MRLGAWRPRNSGPHEAETLDGELKVFAGSSNLALAEQIAARLDQPLGSVTLTQFPDGEARVQINENVRGTDVFVIQSTSAPVDEHLMQLLIMIDALRRASAGRITAVIPYFGYARQEKKSTGREPITAKLVANLLGSGRRQPRHDPGPARARGARVLRYPGRSSASLAAARGRPSPRRL